MKPYPCKSKNQLDRSRIIGIGGAILLFLCFGALVILIIWFFTSNSNNPSNPSDPGDPGKPGKPSDPGKPSNPGKPKTNLYTLVDNISGENLIPDVDPNSSKPMKFFIGNDPTHGEVFYGSHSELCTVKNGKVIINAGSPPVNGQNRKMIRMVSKKMYDSGLFVISADHMPEGNGVWPSFWLDSKGGKKWACDGEIDIIEGVNSIDDNSSKNVSTLHTNDKDGVPGCRQHGVVGITQPDCSKNSNGQFGCGCTPEIKEKSLCPNVGCGVYLNSTSSFGKGFNNKGGGTYVCELTPEGAITVWFFQRGTEPKDLLANNPNPEKWSTTNRTKFNPCPGQFANLAMTLNTTLCGDWAGNVFKNKENPTQDCKTYIKTADLSKAYWSIEYIKVFKRSSPEVINCYQKGQDPFGINPCAFDKCCEDMELCFNDGHYSCQKGPCASKIPIPTCSILATKNKICKPPLCLPKK